MLNASIMPELPEVETVKNNLSQQIPIGSVITDWKFFRQDLRSPIPIAKLKRIIGVQISGFERRAKYILINAKKNGSEYVIVSHLGMTGQWRAEKMEHELKKHDHVHLIVNHNICLVYSDPRRFGFLECHKKKDLALRFEELGYEPFDEKLNLTRMHEVYSSLNTEIKIALLNQKYVVGIGNIYASEALFRAGVNPYSNCKDLTKNKYALILKEIRRVLKAAIEQGGSTISSYKNSYGEKGNFQNKFLVYGREGENCRRCKTEKIMTKIQQGRSTFWCNKCQPKKPS